MSLWLMALLILLILGVPCCAKEEITVTAGELTVGTSNEMVLDPGTVAIVSMSRDMVWVVKSTKMFHLAQFTISQSVWRDDRPLILVNLATSSEVNVKCKSGELISIFDEEGEKYELKSPIIEEKSSGDEKTYYIKLDKYLQSGIYQFAFWDAKDDFVILQVTFEILGE